MTIEARLLSVNIGRPQIVMRDGQAVSTAIYKKAVTERVVLRTLNLDGDRQADLSVHGGPTKAVYFYPSEHYDFWQAEFPEMDLQPGMFGENFTTVGLSEPETNIGDKFRIANAVVMVTEPLMPCYKLGIRFGRVDVIRKFLASGRSGFYCSVLQEGEVGAGDRIELIERTQDHVRVSDITRLYTSEKHSIEMLRLAIELEALPESWKEHFRVRLAKLTGSEA
jgi:MOSC domain-containing protein YiiM